MRATYRRIEPSEQDFWLGKAEYVVLDETKIVEVPIRFFG